MAKKILIVDDSPIARKILKRCLPEDFEYEISEAGDGKAGLERYKEIKPELTFLDLTMPVMDGEECLKEIKKIDINAVVIIVTADIQIQSLKRMKDLGATTILKKPLSKDVINNTLKTVVDFFV